MRELKDEVRSRAERSDVLEQVAVKLSELPMREATKSIDEVAQTEL